MKELTVKEAIEQGYKYAFYTEEILKEIDEIPSDDLEERNIMLASKVGKPFQINQDLIVNWLYDYLCDQDEVYDEELPKYVTERVNFNPITEEINKVLAARLFYYETDIRLIYEPEIVEETGTK